jgi:hypothetical protein
MTSKAQEVEAVDGWMSTVTTSSPTLLNGFLRPLTEKNLFKVKDKTSPIFQHDAISNLNVWRETNLYFGTVVP